jgi:hypothetical protein
MQIRGAKGFRTELPRNFFGYFQAIEVAAFRVAD